jgi:hypothetical protein
MLTRNTKKKLEKILLQESMQGGSSGGQEGLKLPKMDVEDDVNFHNDEQEKLEVVIKKIGLKNWRDIGNHVLDMTIFVMNLETPWEPIWNLIKKQSFLVPWDCFTQSSCPKENEMFQL